MHLMSTFVSLKVSLVWPRVTSLRRWPAKITDKTQMEKLVTREIRIDSKCVRHVLISTQSQVSERRCEDGKIVYAWEERIKKKMAQYKTRKIKTPGGGGYVYDVHLCWSNTFLTLSQKPLLITFPINLESYKCIIISEVHHNFADKEE